MSPRITSVHVSQIHMQYMAHLYYICVGSNAGRVMLFQTSVWHLWGTCGAPESDCDLQKTQWSALSSSCVSGEKTETLVDVSICSEGPCSASGQFQCGWKVFKGGGSSVQEQPGHGAAVSHLASSGIKSFLLSYWLNKFICVSET